MKISTELSVWSHQAVCAEDAATASMGAFCVTTDIQAAQPNCGRASSFRSCRACWPIVST